MNRAAEVDRLLQADGAVLTRQNKHEVWKLSNGRTFTRSSTPSDQHAASQQLRDLRHALGMFKNHSGIAVIKPRGVSRRQPKGTRPAPPKVIRASVNNGLAEELRAKGLIEDRLREEMERLWAQLQKAEDCWWCRLMKKLRSWRKGLTTQISRDKLSACKGRQKEKISQ